MERKTEVLAEPATKKVANKVMVVESDMIRSAAKAAAAPIMTLAKIPRPYRCLGMAYGILSVISSGSGVWGYSMLPCRMSSS